jgi:nitroreductase
MPDTVPPQQLLDALRWRYATQKFDASHKIEPATWSALEEALVLTPSSIGLQPWKFFVITKAEVKTELRAAAWNQSQVSDCSHFVVFAVRKNIGAEHVDRHLDRIVEVRGVPRESLTRFGQMAVKNLDAARAEGRLDTWQTHQIYIALGSFMTAASVMGVDTCPMEGFKPSKFDEILGLTGTDHASTVACAAGYRHPDDKYAVNKKVRFRVDDVIVRL